MKRQNKQILSLIAGMSLLVAPLLNAAQVKFSVIPVAGSVTALLLPRNFTATVSYQVTNQTKITRTLTMVPITGVTQTTAGGGVCANPFTLAPQQTCTLELVLNGSQIPSSGINGGPVVCKTNSANDSSPDPFLCSQPSSGNTLAVSILSTGQHAYIANQLDNSVSVCEVDPVTGLFRNCALPVPGFPGVEGIGFNPAKTFFYAANPLSSSVSRCEVNQTTGELTNCVDTGSGFNLPDAVAFSPDGSIFYTSNFTVGGVSACLVNATTGLLSSCVTNPSPTFSSPGNMTVNAAGTLAYVVNRVSSTVSICHVSGQTVDACDNSSGSLFSGPEGITLSPSGLKAYIANAGNQTVTVCDILQDGTGFLANCALTDGAFAGTGNIGLNAIGTLAYVPNEIGNAVVVCNVDRTSGALSSCLPSLGVGFSGPAGIVLN